MERIQVMMDETKMKMELMTLHPPCQGHRKGR